MALPRLIVCSESYSLDQETNLISIFHIVESLHFTPASQESPPPQLPLNVSPIVANNLSCVAIWTRDSVDGSDVNYEARWEVHIPGKTEPNVIPQHVFQFTRTNQRFILRLQVNPIAQSGMLRIVNKIRRAGATEWQEQSTSIEVTVYTPTDAQSPPNV